MSELPAVLAIDGGNSKTDVALVTGDGTVLASLRGPGTSQEKLGVEGAMRALEPLVREVAATRGSGFGGFDGFGDGPVARHTSACLAGADLPSEEEALAVAVRARGWSPTSSVLNDTFAVLRAGVTLADGERPWGVAVVCGAGINCTGVAPDGRAARFLAFGSLTGDWGERVSVGVVAGAHGRVVAAVDGRAASGAVHDPQLPVLAAAVH
jgi:N-acetylglucosamine kinase-like BadF-type ATPase